MCMAAALVFLATSLKCVPRGWRPRMCCCCRRLRLKCGLTSCCGPLLTVCCCRGGGCCCCCCCRRAAVLPAAMPVGIEDDPAPLLTLGRCGAAKPGRLPPPVAASMCLVIPQLMVAFGQHKQGCAVMTPMVLTHLSRVTKHSSPGVAYPRTTLQRDVQAAVCCASIPALAEASPPPLLPPSAASPSSPGFPASALCPSVC